jgi:16S rRNA (guanine527-N7)-methyltransferase
MSDIKNLEEYMPKASSSEIAKYRSFFDLIEKYNTTVNLIGKSTVKRAGAKHFADSAIGVYSLYKDLVPNEPILDFGSGNGFPGLIAGIILGDWPIILVERDLRKSEFLKTAVDTLKLKNVQVHWGAVSELMEGSCSNIISRAMAPLPKFLLEARGVTAFGGKAFLFKGDHWSSEFSSIHPQLFEYWEVDLHSSYELPANEGTRYIVQCTKL